MNFRALVTPVFAAVVASVAAFVILVLFAASEQDTLSLKSEKALLQQDVASLTEQLIMLASDNSLWDAAVERIMLTEDVDWIDYSIGTTAQDVANIDGTVITRADLSVIYALHVQKGSNPVINADTLLSSSAAETLRGLDINLGEEKSRAKGLIRLDGHLVAYGASLVRATDESPYENHLSSERPIVLFYSVLSGDEISQMGQNNMLEKLRFSSIEPDDCARTALLDTRGITIGWLAWTTRSPGSQMALDMVWPAIILLALVIFAMARFVKRADTLVDGLEQANRSKTAFLASMSHEVRTPLNSILGFSELMALELFGKIEGEKNKEYLHLIQDSSSHLLAIINDILDISKLEAGKFEVYAEKIEPYNIISDCVRMVEPSAKDHAITVTHDCENGVIYSDERIIRQILINILSNAIKFTNQGGAVHLVGERKNEHYQILVTDNGIGMSQKEIEIALSTFGQVQNEYSKNHSGTGLGLALVKRFITLLDGNMDITSNPGKGTTVTLIFPYNTKAKKL